MHPTRHILILALIVNYAGSKGLHVILDKHRPEAGNSAEGNGLWYFVSGKNNYAEQKWTGRRACRGHVARLGREAIRTLRCEQT